MPAFLAGDIADSLSDSDHSCRRTIYRAQFTCYSRRSERVDSGVIVKEEVKSEE
jgi:hypothetical protein